MGRGQGEATKEEFGSVSEAIVGVYVKAIVVP